MNTYTIEDLQTGQMFYQLTQGEKHVEDEYVRQCNLLQGMVLGFVETRRNVLNNEFDRILLLETIEMAKSWKEKKGSKLFVSVLQCNMERITRDIVRTGTLKHFVENIELKLRLFGNVELVADHIENYFTSGDIVPMTQTYREICEENEKGMVIYYEPKQNRTVQRKGHGATGQA